MMELDQNQADELIKMDKKSLAIDEIDLPDFGGSINISMSSIDEREAFSIDVSRGRVELTRGKNQSRGRGVVVLLRLDYCGAPHRNPDGEEMPCPHLHVYRAGFGDKWALPLPQGVFTNFSDHVVTLVEFMQYCNVKIPPKIKVGLFSS